MQAVANNSDFANEVGVNQSIGREFTKENSMKTKKMNMGGMADKRGRAMTRYAGDPRLMADAGGRAMKTGGTVKKMRYGGNTSRMNELEELGRIDDRRHPNRNDMAEKRRVVREIENKKAGGSIRDKEGRALGENKKHMSKSQMADARGRAMKNGGTTKKAKGKGKQGYNARLDESLGMRKGKKSQSFKARRDESKGAKKAAGKRAYSGNKSSAQGRGNASKRADGIAKKGHTRGRHV